MEIAQMSVSGRKDKQMVVYLYNGILLSHKKWSSDAINRDEPPKHYAKRKKPDTKGHIFYYSVYMKYILRTENSKEVE